MTRDEVRMLDNRYALFLVDIVSRHGYNAVADTMSTCERRNSMFKGTPEIIAQRREEIVAVCEQ